VGGGGARGGGGGGGGGATESPRVNGIGDAWAKMAKARERG